MNSKLISNPAQVCKLTAGALRLQASKASARTVCTLRAPSDNRLVIESVVTKDDNSGSFTKIHSIPSAIYRDFPLPGNVGVTLMPPGNAVDLGNNGSAVETAKTQAELPLNLENLKRALKGFELSVHTCPALLRTACLFTEFSDLFPNKDVVNGPLSVVTFSHKTKNDMKFWSPEIEKERTAVYNDMISAAVKAVNFLNELGYWADFIDPYSGKPYYSSGTTDTLTEEDDRMNHFDFEIIDMVCCKVIRHREFGTNVIVGVLFTSAPSHAEPLQVLAAH
ncbi:methylmalonic aciduria and homocystinuria type D [Trichuris trichiura]|uniref:Methylmalonic aciduria and homocystinuria type D n=1 Tax=Trichuris trichiura TaxID=36087 RepID=A0A077YZ88_TRITR|nr:methylmalonic aciduria and homocystinuria type D [Trichuris trichiura]